MDETSARMKHYSEVSRIHPSTCDCHACTMSGKGGSILEPIIGLIALPFQYASMKKEQEKYKEEQKIDKARQAAANHKDAKQYAEFLAVERNHKAEIRKQKAKAYQNQYYTYVVLGGIPAIISVILLVLNFLASLIFGFNPILFSAILILILICSLLGVISGVCGLIEVKNKL